MSAVETKTDLSSLLDATASGNLEQALAQARAYVQSEKADIFIGRLAMVAAHADTEGQRLITLAAAAMLSRLTQWLPAPLAEAPEAERTVALPFVALALKVVAPIMTAARQALARVQYPHP